MAIPIHALNAYSSALSAGGGLAGLKRQAARTATAAAGNSIASPTGMPEMPGAGPAKEVDSFSDTLKNSVAKVNEMEGEKSQMIKEFATGSRQNVHELMITLQKTSIAMSMTTTVRNKVMEAYKELSHIQF